MTKTNDQADLLGGIALGVATVAALVVANSPLAAQCAALIYASVLSASVATLVLAAAARARLPGPQQRTARS